MPTTPRPAGWRKSSYSATQNGCVEVDLSGGPWRKSTYSNQGNGCVEVSPAPSGARIRDTKLADSPIIAFTAAQWTTWLTEVADDRLTGTNGAVTVTVTPGAWTVRAVATGATLEFDAVEWDAFRRGVRDGEFDLTVPPATVRA